MTEIHPENRRLGSVRTDGQTLDAQLEQSRARTFHTIFRRPGPGVIELAAPVPKL